MTLESCRTQLFNTLLQYSVLRNGFYLCIVNYIGKSCFVEKQKMFKRGFYAKNCYM